MIDQPSILDTARRENIEVVKRGRHHVTGCVSHSPDNNPSLILYGERGWCPVCQWRGDALDYVMKLHGLSFKDALVHLGVATTRTLTSTKAAVQARQERERKAALVERFRAWEREQVDYISAMLRAFRSMKARARTEEELISIAEMHAVMDAIEDRYEIFCRKDDGPKFELYQEMTDAGS